MAFIGKYPKLSLPKFLLRAFFLLSLFKRLLSLLFGALGSSIFTESEVRLAPNHLTHLPESQSSISTDLIRKILTVVKFEDLLIDYGNTQDSCAVCLCEFDGQDEIRPLTNCRHIFHRSCLDCWMDHDQRTCPLCRTPFIEDKFQDGIQVIGSRFES